MGKLGGLLLLLAAPALLQGQAPRSLRAEVQRWMLRTGQIERPDGEPQSKVDQVLPAPGHPDLLAVVEDFPAQGQERLHLVFDQNGRFSTIRIPGEQIFPGMIDHLEWVPIPGLPEPILGVWESTTHGNGDLFLFEVHPEGTKLLLEAGAVHSYEEHSKPASGTWKAKLNIWSSTYLGYGLKLQVHPVETGPSDLELAGIEQFYDDQEKLVASSRVSHWFKWNEAKHRYVPAEGTEKTSVSSVSP